MTELTVHEDSDLEGARQKVRGFVDVGDEINVVNDVRTLQTTDELSGTVAALDEETLALETSPGDIERIEYTAIDRLTKLEENW